jgi:hypothetical protein
VPAEISKWMGKKNVEAAGCDDKCDNMCGDCAWEACEVVADDGCECTVKFTDGSEVAGIRHRHLRIDDGGAKRKRSGE